MRLGVFTFTMGIAAFLMAGCQSFNHQQTTEERLNSKAARAANQEAGRLFGFKPFAPNDGWLYQSDDHWVWDALTAVDGRDWVGKVVFDRSGTVQMAQVDLVTIEIAPPTLSPPEKRRGK